ncbi:hypothetical protein C9374_008448 [Naegleria lovaniensis]|uniref:Uncharacterized protein n=1 Tax=Naegleria lovaniensis TaxID=51637 RepID=A0AA88GK77_NAELO|nr:uncharacterized protein C9374_008448 [Naegleria lovaniensis]KAG2378305.1 hypothetical protein C9374_008448 [Naegleria lovaniensis]
MFSSSNCNSGQQQHTTGLKLLNSAGYAWNSHDYSPSSELYNKCQVIDDNVELDAHKRRILKAPIIKDKMCVYNSMMNIENIATMQEFTNFNLFKNQDDVNNMEEDDLNSAYHTMADNDRPSESSSFSTSGDDLLSQARGYQQELVEHCKKENTIIVAPTGAGKTFIAALLIRDTLDQNPAKKILFLVNQISLVDQQATAFQEFNIPRVGAFHSDKKGLKNWTEDSEYHDVIVCTVQILLNSMKNNEERIMEDVQLIIFDECHHAHSNHPFKVLMRDFYKPRKLAGFPIPRIVGLSASPAAKNTVGETILKILQLCHDLDCTVRRVEKNEEELNKYVYIPPIQMKSVDMDPHSERLKSYIYNAIRRVKMLLLEKCGKNLHGDIDIYDDKFGTDEADMWINKRSHIPTTELSNDTECDNRHLTEFLQTRDRSKPMIVLLCQTLSILNECLMINDHRSPYDAWEQLKKFLNSLENKEILSLLSKSGISLSMYEHEHSIGIIPKNCNKRVELARLLTEYKSKAQDMRALIFVKTRLGCKETKEFLETQPALRGFLKLDILLGRGKSSSTGGMTSNQQQTVLTNFRTGVINTLISTSVAEEGIDIPSCSLVVRLDGVDSALNLIQSRGRARSRNSEFFCILHTNSGQKSVERYQMQERKMITAVDILMKAERIHPDIYLRNINLKETSGLKHMVLGHIFEYLWFNSEKIANDETVQRLYHYTEKTITQSSVLSNTCEKLFGAKPVMQVIKTGSSFIARIIITISNIDRSCYMNGYQAARYFVLTTSKAFKTKRDAKNAASLEALQKFMDKDLVVFPPSTWTEIYKEKTKDPIEINDGENSELLKEIVPIQEIDLKRKQTTTKVTDANIFKEKITLETAITCLFHHCKLNFGVNPEFKDFVLTMRVNNFNQYYYTCSVVSDKVSTVRGDAFSKKKDAKKDAAFKMCHAIFNAYHYFDMPKSAFSTTQSNKQSDEQ